MANTKKSNSSVDEQKCEQKCELKKVPTKNEEKEKLNHSKKQIEQQYQMLSQQVAECDNIINELADRLSKQRENRMTFMAAMQKLSEEYTTINKRMEELK